MCSLVFPMPMAGRATDSVARGGEFLHFAIYWPSISMLSSRMLPARTAHIASQIDKQKASPPKRNILVEHLCHLHDLDTPISLRLSVAFCLSFLRIRSQTTVLIQINADNHIRDETLTHARPLPHTPAGTESPHKLAAQASFLLLDFCLPHYRLTTTSVVGTVRSSRCRNRGCREGEGLKQKSALVLSAFADTDKRRYSPALIKRTSSHTKIPPTISLSGCSNHRAVP